MQAARDDAGRCRLHRRQVPRPVGLEPRRDDRRLAMEVLDPWGWNRDAMTVA